jgi:hypothetical protein
MHVSFHPNLLLLCGLVKIDIDLDRCIVFPYAAYWVEDMVQRTIQKKEDLMLPFSKVFI